MKFFNPTTILLALLCITVNSYSQNFRAGYYINLQGDTSRGFTSGPDKSATFDFYFKSTPEATAEKIPFASCRLLCWGDQVFTGWYGRRNMSYVNRIDQNVVNIDSGITGMIPLRLVYAGKKTSLYHFKDETDHFFIVIADTLQELLIRYTVATDWERLQHHINPPTYFINPIFRNQLLMIFGNEVSERQMIWIDATEYTESSLKKFIKKFG